RALRAVMMADGAARVRLERRYRVHGSESGRRRHIEIDVMARLEGQRIALELKYPKARFSGSVLADGEIEDFDLLPGGAPDVDAAAFWRDVERIEWLLANDVIDSGAAIVLSNYPFWSSDTLKAGTQAHAFRLWGGRSASHEVLSWGDAENPEHSPRVLLGSSYECNWLDYSNPIGQSGNAVFKYLALESAAPIRALVP
ncbi:MAG: hypothetical protein ACKOI2_07650, partial [Actinomycetota bacterium]